MVRGTVEGGQEAMGGALEELRERRHLEVSLKVKRTVDRINREVKG